MISVITSSYNTSDFDRFSKSVTNTIGVPFEIIKIDNPGRYSMTQAYNLGAGNAQFEFLCFIHEDVEFLSCNWGHSIIEHFNLNSDLGILGFAGAVYKMLLPGSWLHYNKGFNKFNLILNHPNKETEFISTYNGEADVDTVSVLDGLFLATTHEIWEEFKFDESIPDFHLYDIDFSARVAKKYQLAVMYDTLIKHHSSGGYNDRWLDLTLQYHKTHPEIFPVYDEDKSMARRFCFEFLFDKDISFKARFKYVYQLGIDRRSLHHAYRLLFPASSDILHDIRKKTKAIFNKNQIVV